MKANNGKGNNSERDTWETNPELFYALDNQYIFVFDCCASQENKKCPDFTDNFLSINYYYLVDDTCWMNPPFSKAYEMFEHFFKVVKQGVAIYRCDNMETKIWQEVIFPYASWVFIPDKRISYTGMKGKGARFPSALIGLNVNTPKNINGTLLLVRGYNHDKIN